LRIGALFAGTRIHRYLDAAQRIVLAFAATSR
jgi:hypothetical protein